jgi:hypothetical protein
MGSSGSGSFTDYSKRKSTTSNFKNGGSSGEDNCGKAFSTSLEEVSRCFYFINTGKVPVVATEVRIYFNGVRLSVETLKGEEVGYLPTKFNYLKVCIDDGFKYRGLVFSSSIKPIPSVLVDITPT